MRAIESCPLQWALTRASYPWIWSQEGYPERVFRGTLLGQVVHGVLECIVARITETGGSELGPEATVQALRALGGITVLLGQQIERVAERASRNPRVEAATRDVRGELAERLPSMRLDVQLLLSKLREHSGVGAHGGNGGSAAPHTSGIVHPSPSIGRTLVPGANAEVTLCDDGGLWKGVADLVVLEGNQVEIVDYKTGQHKPEHALQVQLYARLFEEDRVINPNGFRVHSLRVIYPEIEVTVPVPTGAEKSSLAAELDRRASAAQQQVRASPPVAQPGADSCHFCSVKQLCDVFWMPDVLPAVAEAGEGSHADVEVRIHERRAPSIWSATVLRAANRKVGAPIFVRCAQESCHKCELLARASRVRMLGASWLDSVEEGAPVMLGLSRGSEVFVVD